MSTPAKVSVPLLVLLTACASSPDAPTMAGPAASTTSPATPAVQVVFRQGKVFAREGGREWPIAEVARDEMLWAPDGLRFAYLKREQPASRPTASAEPTPGRERRVRTDAPVARNTPPTYHIVIRNIRGDSVNEFPVYRAGRPTDLDWIDNRTIGYQAPPDESGDVYVIHSAHTSEILRIHRGTGFIWSPGRKQLAYVANPRRDQLVKVDEEVVWPRGAVERPPLTKRPKHKRKRRRGRRPSKPRRTVRGGLIWSPDGNGLAFMTTTGKQARLVVLLVVDNPGGDLSWPLPHTALEPGNRVFWGESRVVIGETMLKPRFAASWKRIH
jgi:hypothetical protein